MERAVQVGGEGTPRIAEFAYAVLGARLQMATRTRHRSPEAAGRVDAAMAPFVDGSLPWGRFQARLDGRIVASDPELAAIREGERVRDQFAHRTRSSENGMAGFHVCSTVGVIARLDATVAFLAEALAAFGDTDPDDLRRVKAVALLANPVHAVEVLAAAAALRSRSMSAPGSDDAMPDHPIVRDAMVDEPLPAVDAQDEARTGPDTEDDPLQRMDASARRIGFTPARMPVWLAARTTADARDPATPRSPVPLPRSPGFVFDWSRLLPPLTLHLHLSTSDLTDTAGGVARWEGEGPITHQFVHEQLRPLHRYLIQPVIDLSAMAPVDAYELADRLRR